MNRMSEDKQYAVRTFTHWTLVSESLGNFIPGKIICMGTQTPQIRFAEHDRCLGMAERSG